MTHTPPEPSRPSPSGVSRPRIRALVLGFISGLFLIASFPPIGLWGLVFLAPIPMFVLAKHPAIRPLRAGMYAAIGMMPAWMWLHQWVAGVSAMGFFPLALYLSLYAMAFVWIAHRTLQRWGNPAIVLPLVWVGLEFLRGALVWTGYPWYFVGHPMIDAFGGFFAAPANIAGVYLISFFVALVSAGGMELVAAQSDRSARWKPAAHLFAVVLVWTGLSWFAFDSVGSSSDVRTIRVGVVQSNVPQDNRMNWTTRQRVSDWLDLRDLTYHVARMDPPPEVIVWPEGFVPGWTLDPESLELERNAGVAWMLTPKGPNDVPNLEMPNAIGATLVVDEMLLMQEAIGIPMIVGSVAYDNLQITRAAGGIEYTHDAMYNSVFVLVDGQPESVWYDKLHLTPFGEVMPYISAWSWLENKLLGLGAKGMAFVLSPGRDPQVLSIPTADGPVVVATPICFEATLPAVCRKLVYQDGQRRASVMVNITNDGWFGTWTAGRASHELMARWRCVELATPMIRCANTGISGAIDRKGQVVEIDFVDMDGRRSGRIDQKAGGFVATVELAQGATAYSRVGDAFGWMVLVFMVGAGFVVRKLGSASLEHPNADETGTIEGTSDEESQ